VLKPYLIAVGRLRQGPEKALFDDYVQRFDKLARGQGLGPLSLTEVDAKGAGQAIEAELLAKALPEGATLCCLDERGRTTTSPKFAARIGQWANDGIRDLAFVIGGADGLTDDIRARADITLSFGEMVWPHMLVRVMLAEQLYRAASIRAGTPYHRE